MPFVSDSLADQCRVSACCWDIHGGAAVVLPAWGPSLLETGDSAGPEEWSSNKARRGYRGQLSNSE